MDRVLLSYKIMQWQPPEVNEVHFIASEKSRSLTVCADHIHLLAHLRKSVNTYSRAIINIYGEIIFRFIYIEHLKSCPSNLPVLIF